MTAIESTSKTAADQRLCTRTNASFVRWTSLGATSFFCALSKPESTRLYIRNANEIMTGFKSAKNRVSHPGWEDRVFLRDMRKRDS